MAATELAPPAQARPAAELRLLPRDERDAALAAVAEQAVADYRLDRALTDFEAFGPEDLHGDSTDAAAGARAG